MLRRRLIPVLLLQERRLVKTTRFKRPSYVGDPINAVKIFNDKEVDELIVLDIGRRGRAPDFAFLETLAGEAFMPLTYGGGIRALADAERIFRLGFEKIALRTALSDAPELVSAAAQHFGSQSVVGVLDVNRRRGGRLEVFTGASNDRWHQDPAVLARQLVDLGVGEVLVQAVHRDGTLAGPDLELITKIGHLPVPTVAAGGVASLEDCSKLLKLGVDAVAAGAYFVYHGPHRAVLITYPRPTELDSLLSAP